MKIKEKYDFLVIGGGSGGVRASRMASSFGAKCALIEKSKLGGTCVNLGCVPKKLLVYAAEFAQQFELSKTFGWQPQTSFNWQKLIQNKNAEIQRLNNIYQKLLDEAKVNLIFGEAEIIDSQTVRVGDDFYQADKLLLATGSKPHLLPITGIEQAAISDDLFFLEKLPKKIVVVGAGYIAIEFACIFHSLGSETTIIHRSNKLLKTFDRETVEYLTTKIQDKGIKLELNAQLKSIEKQDNQKIVLLDNGKTIITDLVVFATGRKPNFLGIDVEKLGIKLADNGGISVNQFYQTSIPNIYAIGDIINHVNLTPVAIKQAEVVVNYLFNNKTLTLDYNNLPTAIFSQPNLATVGLSEEDARMKNEIQVYKTITTPMKYSLSEYKEKSLLKLIVDKQNQKILGAHMVGPDAGEIIQIIAIAMQAGVTKTDFDKTIGVHPSLAEEWVSLK